MTLATLFATMTPGDKFAVGLFGVWAAFILTGFVCITVLVVRCLRNGGRLPADQKKTRLVAFVGQLPRMLKVLWWVLLILATLLAIVNSIRTAR